jgi:hypothetical protein
MTICLVKLVSEPDSKSGQHENRNLQVENPRA